MQAEMTITLRIWVRGRKRLPQDLDSAFEPHLEHVHEMLQSGYTSGEIVDERFNGWWETKQEVTPTKDRRTPAHRRFARQAARGAVS